MKQPQRTLTPYRFDTPKLTQPVRFLVVSDLHNEPFDDLLPLMEQADAVLVPGDISNRYRQEYGEGLHFLRESAKRKPTFFAPGNHEVKQKEYPQLMAEAYQTGAEVLVNRFVRFGEVWIGGWYDPKKVEEPDGMDAFEQLEGFKLLLCHKPEHYMRRLKNRAVDLTVAGHAHGGQIRIGGQGIYAPGQLLFPRYTKGWENGGKLLISAGAGNPCGMPRWNNPPEVLLLTLAPR
jgi:predicted MPP superfamily phosphohydrolase